jgi:two-component system, OmpR family, response regulator MprA
MYRKILIADDEPSIREALSKVLRAEGYDIALADNGRATVEKIIEDHIDLLVLDVSLPLMDGWAALERLSKFNPLLPVIVITGRWEQAERAAAAGADILMEKPLDVPRLLQNIRQLLDEPVETRARRLSEDKRDFHSVACNPRQLREDLEKRFTTPFQWSGFKHN